MSVRTGLLLLIAWTTVGRAWAQDSAQAPPGFGPLFDGKTLAGWRGGTTKDPRTISAADQKQMDAALPQHWRVDDGELVSDGKEPYLATDREFGDFELWVDWKLQPKGDSGIYLRGCPQVQLWDPANEAERANGADKGSGGLWNNQRYERFPLTVADRPTGQWNHVYVRMVGELVKVVLNDKLVVDNVVFENYYDRKIPVFARGPIDLQTHGSEARFDNIFVRPIPPDEANKLLADTNGGDEGFKTLFNGHDLDGWIGATSDYEVVDGAIRCKPKQGGNLLTQDEYSNFIVRLEFKLPPGGNNGLAIRTPSADVDSAYEGVELQVLDTEAPMYADIHDYQTHGSAYGLAPAHRGYLRPTGEWNYEEVTVNGDRIQVRLNGVEILDVDLAKVRAKPVDGREHPGASRKSGHFGFAGHNDPVEFRNVRIKPL